MQDRKNTLGGFNSRLNTSKRKDQSTEAIEMKNYPKLKHKEENGEKNKWGQHQHMCNWCHGGKRKGAEKNN